MKRYGLGLVLVLGLAACTGEITEGGNLSPDDPASFDHTMFDSNALSGFDLDDRAYVQGHAIGVYLYGKTLPGYIGHRYAYEPGFSSGVARVRYGWTAVMVARSGGVDGDGNMVFKGEDDTECPPDDDTEPPPDGDTEPPPDGDTEPPPSGDDVGTPGDGDTEPPPDDGGGDDECPPDDDDDDPIDEDCEEFLDPAAMDARELALMVDAITVLGPDYPADTAYVSAFERGLSEALYLEDLHENTDASEIEMMKEDVQDEGLCEHSPLVLDLSGDGFDVAPVAAGVEFDLRANGRPVVTAWPQQDDALLALDRNGNGAIDDGSELFGNSRRHGNGFEALAELDDNADGVIDGSDAEFTHLQLWRDVNHDGVTDDGELMNAAAAGLVQIDLTYSELNVRDASKSLHKQAASFVWQTDEQTLRTGSIVDIWFRYRRK